MSATTTAKTRTGEVVFTIKDDHGLLAELNLRGTSDTFQASELVARFLDVVRSNEGVPLADIDDEGPAAKHHDVEIKHRHPRAERAEAIYTDLHHNQSCHDVIYLDENTQTADEDWHLFAAFE